MRSPAPQPDATSAPSAGNDSGSGSGAADAATTAPVEEPERPSAESPQGSSSATAKTYRAKGRPGLTATGVGVLSTATGVVAGVLSVVTTGGLGWVFGAVFVIAAAYCAWEVRRSDRRTSFVTPPLVLLLVVVVTTLLDGWPGPAGLALSILTGLATSAPMLLAAEAAVGIAVTAQVLRARRR